MKPKFKNKSAHDPEGDGALDAEAKNANPQNEADGGSALACV
jgi:hypothetical protein